MKTFLKLFLFIFAFFIFAGNNIASAQILRKNRKVEANCTTQSCYQYTSQPTFVRNIQPSYSNLQACYPYTSAVPCGQPGCLNQNCPGLNCPSSCCNQTSFGFQGIQSSFGIQNMPTSGTVGCPTCVNGSCKLQKK